LTNRDSFETGLPKQRLELSSSAPAVIIGLKCDLTEKIVVSREELETLAKSWGIPYIEVSSKADLNLDRAVLTLLKRIPFPKSQKKGILDRISDFIQHYRNH
jgi:hypothetical protein